MLCRALPYPYGETELLHLPGMLLIQKGEPARAHVCPEAARAICSRFGERPYAERIEQALAALTTLPLCGRRHREQIRHPSQSSFVARLT